MNILIKTGLIFITTVLSVSCRSKVQKFPDFLRLDKLTTVYFLRSNNYNLREVVIVKNYPEDENLLDSLIDNYLKNKSLLTTIDSETFKKYNNITEFDISFYKQTKCTEYYIYKKESKNHEISGDGTGRNGDCSSDCLGFFSYYRSKEDSTMWYCNYPEDRKDTIWTYKK